MNKIVVDKVFNVNINTITNNPKIFTQKTHRIV